MAEPAPPDPAPERSVDQAQPSEVTSGRLLRNTLVNGVAYASNALVIVVLTPYLLRHLGTSQYGLWVLGLSLTFTGGFLALADFGLPEAAVRFIAEARALGVHDTINRIASTTIAVFAAVGAVTGGLILLLVPWLIHLFGVDPALVRTARVLFTLMALEITVELPIAALRAVIEGLQRYSWLRSLDVGGRLAFGVFAIVAVSQGHGVVALGVITLLVTAVRGAATLVVAHRVSPSLRLRPSLITRETLRTTLGYGSFIGGLRVLSVIYAQMDRAIIGIAISVAAVASYEVVFRVQSIATLVLLMTSSAVLPAAAYNAARADTVKQRELYVRGTKYAMALTVPVSIAAITYARPLIVGWVGTEFADQTTAARLFLILPILTSVNQVGVAMLVGLGKVRRVLLLQLIAVGINLVLSIALVGPFGISGVVVGTLVGATVVWVPYVRELLQTFDIEVGAWLRRVIVPNLPGAAAQIAVGIALAVLLPEPTGLVVAVVMFAMSSAVSLGVFVAVGMSREERGHLLARLTGRHDRVTAQPSRS